MRRFLILFAVPAFSLLAAPAYAQQASQSTALTVVVQPQCGISVLSTQSVASDTGGQTVTVAFNYKLRTGAVSGGGQISLQLPHGATGTPSEVEYATELNGPGTPLSGTADANDAVVVARFGPHTSSSRSGNTGTVRLALPIGMSAAQSFSISCY